MTDRCPVCYAPLGTGDHAGQPCIFCHPEPVTMVPTAELERLRRELAEAMKACVPLAVVLEAALDFGRYAKVLMVDDHVTPEYLAGFREKFKRFEKVVDAAVEHKT